MKAKRFFIQLILCTGLLSGHSVAARTLVIGTISDEPVKEIRTYLPFVKYLAKQLEGEGIHDGEVVIARDFNHMANLIRNGEVDLFVDSPLVALAINKKTGSRLLVRRWKKGIAEYHSVVFVRKDSGINSVADLGGRVIAFEEDFSSSGHLLPRITIESLGMQVVQMATPKNRRIPDQAGFVFSGDDENTIEWVLRGRVDAGAMSMANFERRVAVNRDDLKIILRTVDIPRHSVSITSKISGPLSEAIETALINMHQSEEGRDVLESFERTSKFDAIPLATMNLLEGLQGPVTALVGDN